ncbi:MAG: hypothetical protein DWQ01_12195 [Planctomycetota bacterium]|nr:MAG: hypothetical protein DWQ01_12195 [Planctomycetota bacterium]
MWSVRQTVFLLAFGFATSGLQMASAQDLYLAYDGPAQGDQFGTSVACPGDVDLDGVPDFLVGAPFHDAGGINAGMARLISGASGELIVTFYGDFADDNFGRRVRGAGDVDNDGVPDLVIGAEQGGNQNGGYVVAYSGADGTRIVTLHGASSNDHFGFAVDSVGDVNQDGFAELLVGAFGADDNGSNSGIARVYSGANGNILYGFWGLDAGDQMGRAVAGIGDLDGDGVGDFLLGVPFAGATDAGQVQVHSGATGNFLYRLDGQESGEMFGSELTGLGDLDNDGFEDFAVGAPKSSLQGIDSGRVAVYSGFAGALLFEFLGDAEGIEFGNSISGPGDLDGDGVPDVSISAPRALNNRGYVRSFRGSDGIEIHTIGGPGIGGGQFGFSVAGAGDVNGDGLADLVVGSPFQGNRAPGAGNVQVWATLGSVKMTVPVISHGGTILTMDVEQAMPSSVVHYYFGRFSENTPLTSLGCTERYLQIANPVLAGIDLVDATGVASLSVLIPAGTSGRAVLLQAVEADSCTPSNLQWVILE